MHQFRYKNNDLYCDSLKVEDIARKIPTPFYLYSYSTLIDHYDKLKTAFKKVKPLICFSMKSNSNLSIVKSLLKKGSGLDIVSGGELYRAKLLKVNPKKIVYASVGKTEEEIKDAIKYGILFFNVESAPELELINSVATKLKKKIDVCLRINPNVNALTHHYTTTGKEENKFGLDMEAAEDLFLRKGTFSNIEISGIHVHIGSQITEAKPFVQALKVIISFIKKLNDDYNIELKWLNIGGGLGIVYNKEKPQTAQEFADNILPLIKDLKLKIILEPGRFVVGNAGILVTKVIYVKNAPKKRFVIVDAAMNDLLRPSLYEAYHEIMPLRFQISFFEFKNKLADVVGPICESGDFLGKDRRLPDLKPGDLLAVMGAGAYGFSMSSNYNSRRRPAEVMVKNNRIYTIRSRETYKDLVIGERVI